MLHLLFQWNRDGHLELRSAISLIFMKVSFCTSTTQIDTNIFTKELSNVTKNVLIRVIDLLPGVEQKYFLLLKEDHG